MKSVRMAWMLAVLVVYFGVVAVPAGATTIKSASSYGPGPNSDASISFTSCANGVQTACEAFNLTSQGSVTVDGLLNYNVYQFAFNQNGAGPQVWDVFNLGSLAPGQTLLLTSSLFSLSDLANAQIFSCANGLTTPTDSNFPRNPVNGPCTPGLGSTGDYSALVANGVVNGSASFTTTADFNLTDLVLEVPAQQLATPEPASLALVGTGLVVLLGGKIRRRKRA